MNECSEGIRFSRMPGFPGLFSTYCTNYADLEAFFGGNWRSRDAYEAVAERVQTPHPDAVASVLERQNAAWDAGDASALRKPGTLVVVTGQQLGLFGGPLYTLYKALTTVQLARRLSSELGRTVLPVFWLEGADHDLDEIAALTLLRSGAVNSLRYRGHGLPEAGNLGSVGRLSFTEDIQRIRDELRRTLAPTEFSSAVLDEYFAAYREGTSFMEAFAQSLAALFRGTGLVLVNPEVPELKQLATALFKRELRDHRTTTALIEEASGALEHAYHAQIRARPTNLFVNGSQGREAIVPNGRDFVLRTSGRRFSQKALQAHMDAAPQLFSPNVALRPLLQDTLLPTVAYVAGPGEVSYFAQLRRLYAWAGIPMPIIYPRASVTIVESKVQRFLQKHSLGVADLGDDLERVFQRLVLSSTDVEAMFEEASHRIERAIYRLRPGVEGVDPTLGRSAEAAQTSMQKQLAKLKSRAIRAEKRKHDELRSQLERARHNLYPGGKLQERALPALYFLNKYGPGFLERLHEQVSLETTRHQVVCL